MHFVADLHLHSKFSRAVSQNMTLPVMSKFARQKGLDILSASDFTHPVWFKELQSNLKEEHEGLYSVADDESENKTLFLLSTEVACIYKHNNKLRRVHNLIFAPNLETVEKINAALRKRGMNLAADGRPIIGMQSKHLLQLIMEIDERCFLIPCHVWTPHFGVYGSASGYDSLAEAFEELTPYIYGIETGLSSDPDMNWSIPELATRSILSTSDAHSPAKMGREATVFDVEEPTYENIRMALRRPSLTIDSRMSRIVTESQKSMLENIDSQPAPFKTRSSTIDSLSSNRIAYTLEFYPEEGKYHYSGHRACKVSYGPEAIREKGRVCPHCHKKMTDGVLYRVQQLADPQLVNRRGNQLHKTGVLFHIDTRHEQPPYVKLVPLLEISAESLGVSSASKKAQALYSKLCQRLGSELQILLHTSLKDIESAGGERVAEGVDKVRRGDIRIEPGYDGEYGKVTIWNSGGR